MEDAPTPTVTPSTPSVDTPIQPASPESVAPSSGPDSGEGAPLSPPERRRVAPDELAREVDLDSWTHDDWKKVPGYNAAQEKFLREQHARVSREIETRLQTEAAGREHIQRWDAWFKSLTPEQYRQAMEQPEYAAEWNRLQHYKTQPQAKVALDAASRHLLDLMKQDFAGRPDFEHLVKDGTWEKLVALDPELDPGDSAQGVKFLNRLVEQLVKQRERSFESRVKAEVNKRLAEHHLTGDEADLVPAGSESSNGKDHDRAILDHGGNVENMRAAFKRLHGVEAPV